MITPVPALASALAGMRDSLRRLDRAANVVARSGLEVADANAGTGSAGAPPDAAAADLPGACVEILLAQRAFAANRRVAEIAGEMADEAVRLGDRRG